ncbi:ABC transporter substrate-binding protein [Tissierella sp.]|uniref:ABC transporter substrate-binding protein n=1 Tax=Tissierella sp. TaxID=41274 RepID=UPI00285DBCA6|nr:ABC transporter substrate-binding protein [Tissierella sp.]MDR7855134.1 ABC transporter substrate-binding protein [Tissierella sp.]
MNKYFDVKDKVYDITEKYPETIDIFVANGFEQLANEKMRKIMGKTISVEMACKTKKVNIQLFEQKLIEAIDQNRVSIDAALVDSKKVTGGDIKIDGVLPCPVRLPLLEGFEKWLGENKFDFTVDYDLKVASGGVDWIKEKIEKLNSEDELSDLFMSAGFDLFFDKKLMGKFKEQGVFEDLTGFDNINKDFQNKEINLKDPDNQYSMIGVVPAVFLVNKEEIGDRQMPQTWADLFKPEFEGEVSLPIGDFDLFNAILLNIYKSYGKEGLRSLGKCFMRNMHPAEMVKSHIRKKDKPTITIMPYFFTKMITGNGPMLPIWPKDGSIISPIFLLTKNSKREQIKPFVDFFASKEVGEILSHNGRFPSTNPEVENNLTEEQKFMWLGWDFIKSHDIGELIKECERIFNESI